MSDEARRASSSSSSSSSSSRSGIEGERRTRRSSPTLGGSGEPPRRSRVVGWVVIALGAVVAALLTYLLVVFPMGAGPGSGRDVELTLERDESLASVASKLEGAGLLRSPGLFGVYVRLVRPRFAPGHHLVTDDASVHELVARLERMGGATRARVVVPEGWNRFEIARRLQGLHVASAATFLESTMDRDVLRELAVEGESVEGFLLPATYDLALDADPRDVVRRMKSEFDRRFAGLEQAHALGRAQLEGQFGWGRREIVTLASMVEKEAAVDEERPVIASVFLNRLRDAGFKRKVLQCDPTSAYGCLVLRDRVPACAGFAGRVNHAINVDPLNMYSTYVHEGLPPGPIANPGIKSLQAVLAPASTNYLYFVARGEGRRHAFSETFDEHNSAIKDLRDRQHPSEGRP